MTEAPPLARKINLPDRLGGDKSSALLGLLAPHVLDRNPVLLDAQQVSIVQNGALQILLAFVRVRREAGTRTRWLNVSGILLESAARLGVATTLGLAGELA